MKTAMQELIELLELDEKHKEALPYLIDVIKEVYVSKEKEQIIIAHDQGIWPTPKAFDDGEEYYNQTYNQNK